MFGLIPFDRRRNQLQTTNTNNDRTWDIDRIFENFFNDAIFPSYYNRSSFMRVDIKENDNTYLLEAELPGVSKEQINIETDHDLLTISVNQDETKEVNETQYLRRERRCCSMTRSFNIENIDADNIKAKMDNGVLMLELPKREPDKQVVRKIDIG
ncbi:MAG: Hsp20/alpha crystallin family protein [Bacillota bacterium]|nr:Hsp20/alpha crystallin family protein [Bacillota bacterium]